MAECFLKRTIIQGGGVPADPAVLYVSLETYNSNTRIQYTGETLNVNILYSNALYSQFIDGSMGSPTNVILSHASGASNLFINNNAFYVLSNTLIYDFSQFTFIPNLQSSNAFININPTAQIIVPASLYNTWRSAQYWVAYQSQIVSA